MSTGNLANKYLPKINHVDPKINHVVFGYIRQSNKGLSVIVPIINIILLYYYNSYQLFHPTKHGKKLMVFKGGTAIKKVEKDSWSNCTLATPITDKIWDKFVVHIKWNDIKGWFMFGCQFHAIDKFDAHPSADIIASLTEGSTEFSDWESTSFQKKSDTTFKNGDIFSMVIDFNSDAFSVYYNGNYAGSQSLQKNKVIFLFWTFSAHEDQEIEILDQYTHK